MKKYIPYILFAVLLIIDQITKFFVAGLELGKAHVVIPGIFWITHVDNTGISFGVMQGNNLLMIWLAILIFGALLFFYDRFTSSGEKVGYWLIMSGLFGNLIDRIFRGAVVDMFDLGWFPVFNVADSAICIGVVLLIIQEIPALKKGLTAKKRKGASRSKA